VEPGSEGCQNRNFDGRHDSLARQHDGLKDLGYVEGKNVVFEARATRGEPSRLTRYKIGQLVDRKFLITNDILDQITY
jgi:hypothetical protein